MKRSTKLRAQLLTLASALVFGVAGTGIVHADRGGYDMSDSIAPGDSAAVRDTASPNQDESIKQKWEKWNKGDRASTRTTPKHDNSRYSTDGTERYDDDEGSSGTGPKLPGRY